MTEPPVAAGGRRVSRLPLWAAFLALAWAGYYVASGWAMNRSLARLAERQERELTTGWQWPFDRDSDLVGGRGVGLQTEIAGGRLRGRLEAGDGFLSLNFRGRKLDAQLFNRLILEIDPTTDTRVRIFHRERLAGPVIAAEPIPVPAGSRQLELDLQALAWTTADGGSQSAWGGSTGTVASLRVHPLDRPGMFAMNRLAIAADPDAQFGSMADWTVRDVRRALAKDPALFAAPRIVRVQVPSLRDRPARILHLMAQAEDARPAWIWAPETSLPRLDRRIWPALCGLALLAGVLWPKRRRWALLVATGGAAATALAIPPNAATLMAVAIALVIINLLLLARAVPSPVILFRVSGSRPALVWTAVLLAPLPVAARWPGADPADLAGRLALYLPWAALQQWILHRLLIPATGGHQSFRGTAVGSMLFGLLHFPNFALMVATQLLAVVTAAHFSRHRSLAPLAVMHAVTGTLYLELMRRDWLWSGEVGMRFFGAY